MKAEFDAVIKEHKSRIDAVGDKVGRIVLEIRPTDDLIDTINRLQQPDCEVKVLISDNG